MANRLARLSTRVAVRAATATSRLYHLSTRVAVQSLTYSRLAGQQIEVVTRTDPDVRLAGQQLEVLTKPAPDVRLAGQQLEVVVPTYISTEPANTAYTTAVKADSPLAYWRLEDGIESIRVYDSSGNARHGTRTGGSDIWSPVDNARAIAFTGITGEGVDCGASNIVGTGLSAMSLECWFKTTLTTSPQILIAARDFGGATGNNNYELYISNGKPTANFYCASGSRGVPGGTNRNDGNWHHLVGTYDGATGTVRLYVDGVEETPSPTTGAVIGNVNSGGGARLRLVNYYWNNTTTAISIDEAAIYGTVLSSARVAAHYAARLATATRAQTSRESLRVATQAVGAAQVSRLSLRVAEPLYPHRLAGQNVDVAIAPSSPANLLAGQNIDVAIQPVPANLLAGLNIDVAIAAGDYQGVAPPSGPTYSVWNGTVEVPATMTVWNGTAEVAATAEIAP